MRSASITHGLAWNRTRRRAASFAARAVAYFVLISMTIWSASPALAQPQLSVVGTWGGAVNAVFVDEANPDMAYVGSGRRLVILNVGDPGNILELGSIDLGHLLMDVKVRAGYAYVAMYSRPNTFCLPNRPSVC